MTRTTVSVRRLFHGDHEQLTLSTRSAVDGCAALLLSQPHLPWD
ncbi:hypothetical protein ABZ599_39090 [Streptomyces misionensis]